jgi:hypothetical protein
MVQYRMSSVCAGKHTLAVNEALLSQAEHEAGETTVMTSLSRVECVI